MGNKESSAGFVSLLLIFYYCSKIWIKMEFQDIYCVWSFLANFGAEEWANIVSVLISFISVLINIALVCVIIWQTQKTNKRVKEQITQNSKDVNRQITQSAKYEWLNRLRVSLANSLELYNRFRSEVERLDSLAYKENNYELEQQKGEINNVVFKLITELRYIDILLANKDEMHKEVRGAIEENINKRIKKYDHNKNHSRGFDEYENNILNPIESMIKDKQDFVGSDF